MENRGTAFFVRAPRTVGDLCIPHLARDERAYEVTAVITLAAMEYGSFITDLRADWAFLAGDAPTGATDAAVRCLLVKGQNLSGGVLVVPKAGRRVAWAAYRKA